MTDPRYPIGRFQPPDQLTPAQRDDAIAQIAAAPAAFRRAAGDLTPEQLDTPYREGGWTVRQVVHHLPDSHLNAYVRFKLALTEDGPAIKTYDEKRWAETGEVAVVPPAVSLALLESLHERWVGLLRTLTPADFGRVMQHPEWKKPPSLDQMLALYAWHGRHHTAHVTTLRERMGW